MNHSSPSDAASSNPVFIKTYTASKQATKAVGAFKFSIKDLFDVAGEVTTAGSKLLAHHAPAQHDAVAVARLKHAGGIAVGRTNMSEFAFSGVGFNPHYGTPINPCDRRTARIPGGSSSGAAVSVASRKADIGLGSDTGGSLRIPAALCGLVGFKSTAHWVPLEGAFPLSATLDTVGAITRNVATAIRAHEILANRHVAASVKKLSDHRVAVIGNHFLDGCDDTVKSAFTRTLDKLQHKGLRMEVIECPALKEIPHINRNGGFSPIEAYQLHRDWIQSTPQLYDPRVAQRIMLGAKASEQDIATLHAERAAWIARMMEQLAPFDAVLSPTVPMVAPPIASIASDDAEFFRVNALLLRNPSVVNLLDGCAISIPCQMASELPVGLMVWHGALHDDAILHLAKLIESLS